MRIAFIISTMSHGGAERVASMLCNSWVKNEHLVDLILLEPRGTKSHYKLERNITIHQLDLLRTSFTFFQSIKYTLRRIFGLRKVISNIQPDIVISFMIETNLVTLISLIDKSYPVIVSERIHPEFHKVGYIKNFLRKKIYKKSKAFVVQTSGISNWFDNTLNIKTIIIENPLDISVPINKDSNNSLNRYKIISAGRLENQKGFDFLIDSFSKLAKKNLNWDLYIYGDGSEREKLLNKISMYGLSDRVFLKGVTKNMHYELVNSDLFILASRYEGFPNILCEAMGCGLAVISTNCPDGPGDIIEHEKNGLLVEVDNEKELISAIDMLINDEQMRKKISNEALNIKQRLDINVISNQWIRLIEKIVAEN